MTKAARGCRAQGRRCGFSSRSAGHLHRVKNVSYVGFLALASLLLAGCGSAGEGLERGGGRRWCRRRRRDSRDGWRFGLCRKSGHAGDRRDAGRRRNARDGRRGGGAGEQGAAGTGGGAGNAGGAGGFRAAGGWATRPARARRVRAARRAAVERRPAAAGAVARAVAVARPERQAVAETPAAVRARAVVAAPPAAPVDRVAEQPGRSRRWRRRRARAQPVQGQPVCHLAAR